MQEKRKLGFLIIISNINRGCIISAKQQLPYHAQIYTKAASMLAANANLQPSKLKSSSVRIVKFLIAFTIQYDYGVKYV